MKLVSSSQILSVVTGLAVAMAGMVSVQAASLAAIPSIAAPAQTTAAPMKIAKKMMATKKKSSSGMMKKSGTGMMKKP